MQWLFENWEHLLALFGAVVAASSALVKALTPLAEMTPSERDDMVLSRTKIVLDYILDVLRKVSVTK